MFFLYIDFMYEYMSILGVLPYFRRVKIKNLRDLKTFV